jgi:hypothetical protein
MYHIKGLIMEVSMRQKIFVFGLVLILLITGCGPQSQAPENEGSSNSQAAVVTPAVVVETTEEPAYPAPAATETALETAYPAPESGNNPTSAYPAPSSDTTETTGETPYPGPNQPNGNNLSSPLDPVPGEESMTKGKVFIDSSEVKVLESDPVQAGLVLVGSLPTPCHYLRVTMTPPDAENKIALEVYSVTDPATVCVTVLQPFETTISLGSFTSGTYTIWVNGQQVGEYTQ